MPYFPSSRPGVAHSASKSRPGAPQPELWAPGGALRGDAPDVETDSFVVLLCKGERGRGGDVERKHANMESPATERLLANYEGAQYITIIFTLTRCLQSTSDQFCTHTHFTRGVTK